MVNLRKNRIVGEIPVIDRIKGSSEEGKVVGKATLEKLSGGRVMAHIDMSGMTAEILLRGFSFGPHTVIKDDALFNEKDSE